MVADRFRLRYKLSPEYYDFYSKLATMRSNRSGRWGPLFSIILYAILIAGILFALHLFGGLTPREVKIAAACLGLPLIYSMFASEYFGKVNSRVGSHDAAIGQFTLAAYEGGGIQITGKHMQSSYDWSAFIDLTQSPDIMVIWIDTGVGVILPNSAFTDDDEKQAFADFVTERIVAHTQMT
ncbi:MAG: YcxB family protein [bacterium]|nr:YcxB family protein [bacterium]